MKKLFFSPHLALLLILALILPPQSALFYSGVHPSTLRPSNAGMEESKVRGQLETALNPAAGGSTKLTTGPSAELRTGLEKPAPRGENRRPEFPIKPEEVLLYRKRAGESTDRKVSNSIWNYLPSDFRDATLLTPLEQGSEGLVLLTRNSILANTGSGFNLDSVPVTYEMNVSRLPNNSEMKGILNGTWVRVRGPRRNGNRNGSVFFKPVKAKPIREEGSGGRLRITFSHGSRQLVRAMLEKRGIDAAAPTRATFGSIELNGMPPGGHRRARWQELLALTGLYGLELFSNDPRRSQQETAIQEETVDQELILGLLENEQYLRNVFESIFSRPDLAKRPVEGQDIVHVWEGGFKRVYRVTLSLQGEPAPFSFYAKIVKPDVVRSDSGYLYDVSYVNRMTEIADQARQKFLFLHPPSAPNQFLSDRMGRSRIVFSEGVIFPTNAQLASSEARRLAIETYMKLYLVFDGKVFFEDPKPENTVLHRLSRRRYGGTLVDLDNLLEVGRGLDDSGVATHLLDYGFKTDEIVPAMENILGTQRTLELLNAARWIDRNLGIRRSDFQDRYPDNRRRLQQSITAGQARPPLPIPASIRIMLNGREQIVPEGVTLADLLSDRYVNIQSIAVRVNESPLPEEAQHSLNLVKRWALYDQTPAREGWSITWVPVKKPVPKPEEKPGEERIHVKSRKVKMRDLRQTGFDRELKELRDALARFRRDLPGRHVTENEYFRAAHHALGRLIDGMDRYLKQPLIYPLNRRRIKAADRAFDRVDFKDEDDRRQKRRQLTELVNTGIALNDRFRRAMNSDAAPAAGGSTKLTTGSSTELRTGLEEGSKQAWPLFNTGAIGLVAGGLIGSAAMVMAGDMAPQQAQRVLLLSMVLGSSAAYAVRARWFRPRITRGVDRLLREGEKPQPGLRERFFALREAIRPRVLLRGKDNRLTQRTLFPQLVDWITYWIQRYEIAPLLGETSLVVLRVGKASSGESKAFHAHVLKGGGSLISVSLSSQHRRYAREVRAQAKQFLRRIQILLEFKDRLIHLLEESAALVREQERIDPGWAPSDSFKQGQAKWEQKLSEIDHESEDLKRASRVIEILLGQINRSRGRGEWEETALSTEAFHLAESWVQVSLGMPAVSAEEFSEQSGQERLNPGRLIRVQSEAGDHLSHIVTGAWNPEFVPILVERLDKQDEAPPTNNHALATLVSVTALQKVDQWIRNGEAPASFRNRLLFRMMQLNSLTNVTLEYGEEKGIQQGVYERVMKMLGAPDVLTQFWMEDRSHVMPLARFARSVQDFRRPADLYDRLRRRIAGLQQKLATPTLSEWVSSLDQEQRQLKTARSASGLEETSAASVEVAEGMARANDFLGQVGSDPSVLFGAGLHDLTESFGESPAIQAFTRDGVRPLLLVDPKYERALREQLSFALTSGIVGITVDPSAARFVIGDRDFVQSQKGGRLVSGQAVFLQVDPSTVSSLTQDFLTLVAAYQPGAVLVVGTQTERADAVVLFESA